jgi:trehalose 6-phosphate phosphatase
MDELKQHLDEIARAPVLLVASDFDGTIAPIVSEPTLAEANRESLVALRSLSQMPQTHVAIISGRALKDLAARTIDVEHLHLVGSHGSEFEAGFATPLAPQTQALLTRLETEVQSVAEGVSGSVVEPKPAGLAFHYRNADEQLAEQAVEAILDGPGREAGVYVRRGKKVLELSVVQTDKGQALRALRQRLGASAVLFFGDDVTDEDAFATLMGPDVGIKVGPGESAAPYRVVGTVDVAQLLACVSERRSEWLAGSHAVPIEQHWLLSDQRTVALVDPTGNVAWFCVPRIDSPAVFASLLGGPTAGFFEVKSAQHEKPLRQGYVGDTFILETQWPGFTVTDYLDCGGGRAFQRAGRTDLIRVIKGRGRVAVTFAPRLDFGRVETKLRTCDAGVETEGAVDPLVLRAPGLNWHVFGEGQHHAATATFELADQPVVLELRFGTASLAANPLSESVRRQRTEKFWSGWADTLSLPSVARELVRRSALVLKALCYGPTGAIAAAATTSLPEHAGGVRNWDYRFCWPRDAAMSAAALLRLGMTGPALRFLDWVLSILDQTDPPALLRPVYSVTGAYLGPEGEITELAGYRGSRPVRVGNAAAQQLQLDVFGPVVELVALLASRGAPLSSEHWRMVAAMVEAVGQRWREADHGIWEVRSARQHHVHSKVMCWQCVDRALKVGEYLGRRRRDWEALREEIATDVLQHGCNAEGRRVSAWYSDHAPDAAALQIGLSGLLPPEDDRFRNTVEYVERHLHVGPTVYRYSYDDGLPGIEGGFNLCTTWLIEAYALLGRHEEAQQLFEQYVKLVGPTGLMSEEYDPGARQALGNYPQAYSHLGLINAALVLNGG